MAGRLAYSDGFCRNPRSRMRRNPPGTLRMRGELDIAALTISQLLLPMHDAVVVAVGLGAVANAVAIGVGVLGGIIREEIRPHAVSAVARVAEAISVAVFVHRVSLAVEVGIRIEGRVDEARARARRRRHRQECLLSELVRRSDRCSGADPRAPYAAFAHVYRWWRPPTGGKPANLPMGEGRAWIGRPAGEFPRPVWTRSAS